MQNDFIGLSLYGMKIMYFMLVSSFASIFAYLNIDQEMILMYSVLLFIDLTSGVAAAMIAREEITLSRLNAGILSKLIMFVVPITVAILVKMQGTELLWFTKWTLIVLGASEAVSILNNVLKAKGMKQLPEFDAIGLIAEKIRNILEKLFNSGGGKNV